MNFDIVYRTMFLAIVLLVIVMLSGCSTPIERIKQHKQIVVSETLMQARPICSQEQQGRSIVVYTCR